MKEHAYLSVFMMGFGCSVSLASTPVVLRVGHFMVPPSTGPVTHIFVRNPLDRPYQGIVRVQWPTGWRGTPESQDISLEPRETRRLAFVLEKATDRATNRYPVEVIAEGKGERVVHHQEVMCTSAPFFIPRIDGQDGDWADAIGVTFSFRDKRTVVKTFWNEGQFCLLVEVEEDELSAYRRQMGAEGMDAVRFALFPKGAVTGDTPTDKARRYEFLLAASAARFSADKCFLLLKPGDPLGVTQEPRDLARLICKGARVVVKRGQGITRYECAVDVSVIPEIRLGVGREIGLALLVHDVDASGGTGVRDWTESMGLWTTPNSLAWCKTDIAPWGDYVPHTNKIEWGLCSSKH